MHPHRSRPGQSSGPHRRTRPPQLGAPAQCRCPRTRSAGPLRPRRAGTPTLASGAPPGPRSPTPHDYTDRARGPSRQRQPGAHRNATPCPTSRQPRTVLAPQVPPAKFPGARGGADGAETEQIGHEPSAHVLPRQDVVPACAHGSGWVAQPEMTSTRSSSRSLRRLVRGPSGLQQPRRLRELHSAPSRPRSPHAPLRSAVREEHQPTDTLPRSNPALP